MTSQSNPSINKAVRYDQFGPIDVLYIADLPKPSPEANQVLVRVKAAGINPGETSIREGRLKAQFPSVFPSGQGSDFSGIIETVGSNVDRFNAGDEVIGFSNDRSSQAQYVVVDQDQVVPRPAGVSWEQAGGLFVAGTTAYAGVQALSLMPGDLLIVSGAAGGVGSLAVQLAKLKGAEVIGFASPSNHDWLIEQGVTPVAYGKDKDDNEKAVRAALQDRRASAFFDASGKGYVALALQLGIPKDRINTIIDFDAVAAYGVKSAGSAQGATAAVLAELASLISDGKLQLPIASTYPLAHVRDAYRELEARHTHGKIVLIP